MVYSFLEITLWLQSPIIHLRKLSTAKFVVSDLSLIIAEAVDKKQGAHKITGSIPKK